MSNLYVLYETSLGHYILFLCSCLFTWSVVSLYLDDLKLHNNIYIKYIQLFCLISIPLYVIYSIWNYVNIITHVKDNDINLHGHVSLNKEAAAEISKGISIIGSNLGLGATIAGIGTAVAKGVAKSSMPPLQKAGLIINSGLIIGVGHSIITNINKYKYSNENISSKTEFIEHSNKYLINDNNNNNYSTLFICLIAPIFLCIMKIKWNLYPLAFFKVIWCLVPDIIVDNLIIFIYITLSNIITIYIAYLSISTNSNLIKNIICLFKKENLLTIILYIVIYLKEKIYNIFKHLKDNIFYIVLTLIIIIFVTNIFRQPIFILLGKDIFSSFLFYLYVMFSSILPTTYIITILDKRFKTKRWNFSLRLIEFKEKITIFSLLILIISLYVSYFYIWPLMSLAMIYCIQYKNSLDCILNTRSLRGLRQPSLSILTGIPVIGVFQHYGNLFTRDELLSTIEHSEPTTRNENPTNKLTRYSENKWISKAASTTNIRINAQYSAENIKTPYLPTSLFKSYWNNPVINFELINYDTANINLPINIALYYLKVDNGFYHYFGGPSGGGWVNRPLADLQTAYVWDKHCTIMTRTDKPLSEMLKQICYCAAQTISNRVNNISPFMVICNEKRIAFATYDPNQILDVNYPFKKGRTFQDIGNPTIYTDTPDFNGIIGLIATTWGVERIPQQNVYRPQLAFYDITNERHAFAIHMIFKYLSINPTKPNLDENLVQTNNDPLITENLTEKMDGGDDLGIRLEQNGRLIR